MIDRYNVSIMELRHLRYFIGVAEELHFARAATRLGISQPPLSQQIGQLEQELGVRLFDRTSRSVKLTSAGSAFLPEARATLEKANRAINVAHRASRGELGELNLGFNASAPFVPMIARSIYAFRQAWPDVKLNLTEVGGRTQTAALIDHTLDACFVRGSQRPDMCDAIEVTPILRERLFVALRPDHRLARRNELNLSDLAGEPLLIYKREHCAIFTEELFAMLRGAGVEPAVAHEVSEISSLFGLAAAGIGLCVIAESMCALQSAKLVYRPLADAESTTAIWLVHLREGAGLPCRNFLEIIAKEAMADA
jgi:DNA-binding transcriptional LysR family regulator